MKKLIVLSVVCLIGAASFVYSATNQPQSVGTIKATRILISPTKTIAQLNVLIPDATGQIIACTDCVVSSLCISSGSVVAGSWVILVATGAFAGSTWSGFPHCQ